MRNKNVINNTRSASERKHSFAHDPDLFGKWQVPGLIDSVLGDGRDPLDDAWYDCSPAYISIAQRLANFGPNELTGKRSHRGELANSRHMGRECAKRAQALRFCSGELLSFIETTATSFYRKFPPHGFYRLFR